MRYIALISAFIFSQTLFSQESETLDSLWTKRGKVGVLLNQTGFSIRNIRFIMDKTR